MKNFLLTIALSFVFMLLISCTNEKTKKTDYYLAFSQGQEHYRKSEFLLALSIYNELEEHIKHPVLDTLYFNRGICYMEAFNFELALSDFFTSIKNGYRVSDAHHNIALCYFALNSDSMAIKYFHESLKVDSNNLIAKEMLLKLGNPSRYEKNY